jgi:GNAT superfamily N-acetyltransferase
LQEIEAAAGLRFVNVGLPEIAASPPTEISRLQSALDAEALWVADLADAGIVAFAVTETLASSLHLSELSVLSAHGRRGVGAALVRHAERRAAQLGLGQLTLSTFSDVPWNGPFYAKLGFRVLADHEITPDLAAVRAREQASGLPTKRRIFMALHAVPDRPMP